MSNIQPQDPQAMNPVEAAIDEYVADYGMEADDGYYDPSESERFIIKDAIMGLLADPGFVAAYAAAMRGQQWQQIETAPKDGTAVLLWVEDAEHPFEDQPTTVTLGSYGVEGGPDEDPNWNFAGWSWEQDCYCRGFGRPTHWMPLPAAPVAPTAARALPQGEPIGWMRPDELQKAQSAPHLCRVHPERDKRPDMVPVYTTPPTEPGVREALEMAYPVLMHYASANPKQWHDTKGWIDPNGVHAAALAVSSVRAALKDHP